MKVVVAHRSGEVRVLDISPPPIGPRTVLVRVTHCAVSPATELSMIRQVRRYLQPGEDGIPLGYSCSGTIEKVGEAVRNLREGFRVACYGAPYVYHAEMLSVPRNLAVELPKKVNHEEGAFTGIGAIAMHAFRQAEVGLGESVVVFGAGLIGNLACQIARAAGATPILVDALESRLQKAKVVGVQHTTRSGGEGLARLVAQVTDGLGADAAILCSEADDEMLAQAVDVLRDRGRLVAIGGGDLRLPVESLYFKEISLRMARAAGPGRYDAAYEREGADYPAGHIRWPLRANMAFFANLVADRKVQISPLITDRIPLERAPSAYEKLHRGLESCYAITLTT